MSHPTPPDGGSYRRLRDGSLVLLSPTTGPAGGPIPPDLEPDPRPAVRGLPGRAPMPVTPSPSRRLRRGKKE